MVCRADADWIWKHGNLKYRQEGYQDVAILGEARGPAVPIPSAPHSEIILFRKAHKVLDS